MSKNDGAKVAAAPVLNYRIEDFAHCFAVSRRTAWQLISTGEIDALKVGRRTLITAESAWAWRERCPRVQGTKSVRESDRNSELRGEMGRDGGSATVTSASSEAEEAQP